MNQRLQQFINAENISQSQFADNIGVARASVSHIIAGRNKPGFDFILGMTRAYPALNVDWLITGKGKMYRQAEGTLQVKPQSAQKDEDLFAEMEEEVSPVVPEPKAAPTPRPKVEAKPEIKSEVKSEPKPETTSINNLARQSQSTIHQRTITKILVFYDDNTFQELK